MFARRFKCTVTEKRWLTPTVFALRFIPSRRVKYEPGQFISVTIPPALKGRPSIKRCYSLASAPGQLPHGALEIWVKLTPGGLGSTYLAQLEKGNEFDARGPFGLFRFKRPTAGRQIVFIATGTGAAPIQSMLECEEFKRSGARALVLVGVQDESEILSPDTLSKAKAELIFALSRPGRGWAGFRGRVTDFLHALPRQWSWHSTDFYIVGSGEMVRDVVKLLTSAHGVSPKAIHGESFSAAAGKPKIEKVDLSTRNHVSAVERRRA